MKDKDITLQLVDVFKTYLDIKPFKAHKGYDFTEKKSIQIPAHNVIRFTPCEEWRKQVLRKEIVKDDK